MVCVAWENIVSEHGAATVLIRESFGNLFFGFYIFYYCYVFLMFQTNVIMAQNQINFLNKTNEYWLVFLGRTFCQIMEQLRPKIGNPLEIYFGFSLFMNIMSS